MSTSSWELVRHLEESPINRITRHSGEEFSFLTVDWNAVTAYPELFSIVVPSTPLVVHVMPDRSASFSIGKSNDVTLSKEEVDKLTKTLITRF